MSFSATLDDTFGTATHTGTVVASDASGYTDMVSVTSVDSYGASTTFKIHRRSDLTDSVKHFGGRPALAWKLELILSSGTFADEGYVKYNAAARMIRITSQLLGGSQAQKITLDADPVVSSGESIMWNAKGLEIRDVPGLAATSGTTSPVLADLATSEIVFPFSTSRSFKKTDNITLKTGMPFSFEISPEASLRPANPNTKSINERLGHWTNDNAERVGEKNMAQDKGTFKSSMLLHPVGETVYLCSSTLSASAILLPFGGMSALAAIQLGDKVYQDSVTSRDSFDKMRVDCGGLVLNTLHFSIRDFAGNLVPLGQMNWTAQLCFGYD